MQSIIRNPRDFWSGAIFIAFGAAAVFIGRDYSMGTAGRMGPAYFPSLLGAILAVIGTASLLRSMVRRGEAIGRIAVRELLLVVFAVALFGVLVRGAGLALAVVALVMFGSYASIRFKLAPYLALALGLAAFCVLVFVKGLGLPMPVFGHWLGF